MPLKNKLIPLPSFQNKFSEGHLTTLIGYHLKRALNVFHSDLTRVLEPFGLRTITFSALMIIKENPGINQSQLATLLDIERPNLVVVVDNLEERGLIRREQVPNDRRTYALHISKEGSSLLTRAQNAVYAHEHRLLEDQSPEQIRMLVKALKAIEAKGHAK